MKKNIFLFLLSIAICNSYSQNIYKVELVKDINSVAESFPSLLTVVNNKIFFKAIGDSIGSELFVSDGTANGTHIVKNINTQHYSSSYNENGSSIYYLTPFDNKVIFTAIDDIHGDEPWISDGTDSGTFLLGDLRPSNMGSNSGSNPQHYINYGNKIYFSAQNYTGDKLFVTDGTVQGATIVKNITGSGNLMNFYVYNNILYFNANGELWRSDGTDTGTYLLKDMYYSSNFMGNSNPDDFIEFQNKLFFTADDSIHGREIWTTDGTTAGTVLFKDINTTFAYGSGPTNLTVLNDKLFFYAGDSSEKIKIWYIQGDSVYFVKTVNTQINCFQCSYPLKFHKYNNKIYFSATDNTAYNCELWVTDGTSNGTYKILSKDSLPINDPWYFLNWDGKFVFIGGKNDKQLWISDGTLQGTHKILPDSLTNWCALCNGIQPVILNNEVYFTAKYSTQIGSELYKLSIDTTLGINNENKIIKNKPLIYPNPFSNDINIDITDNGSAIITLTDLTGRTLKKINQQTQTKNYNFPNLNPGIYILTITCENKIWTEKIIKY